MLTAVTLVEGEAGDGGARTTARYKTRLLLCSEAATALLGSGSDPKLHPWAGVAEPLGRRDDLSVPFLPLNSLIR